MSDRDVWCLIERLYREGFERFVRVARAVTGDRESAIDAVQEGFVDALRGASQWAGRGPLEGWVWSCVLNRARKARRRHTVAPVVGFSAPLAEDDADLRARLAALPERQRLVVFLRYFADLSYQEIAAAVGIEVGTVSATLHAAHRALREGLKEVQA
jgi:RNA polymerase sigma-70 factor (ECF subfamily)